MRYRAELTKLIMLRRLFLFGVCLSTLFATSCTTDEEQEVNGNGTISLRITDAPIDAENIAGVYVTFDRVEYKHEGSWHTFESFEGPKTINLLELTEGRSELLGNFNVEAGAYSEIRFHLNASENGGDVNNPATYVAFTDGSKEPLYVPSGTQSGYKATADFVVPVDGNVVVTADFDIRKSVVRTGNDGKWMLKPVIRLVVNDDAGSIAGKAEEQSADLKYVVYTYADDTFVEDEALEGETLFPAAVSSALINADGSFTLPYLQPGKYDVVVAAYKNGDFQGVVNGAYDVEVNSLQSTPLTITF